VLREFEIHNVSKGKTCVVSWSRERIKLTCFISICWQQTGASLMPHNFYGCDDYWDFEQFKKVSSVYNCFVLLFISFLIWYCNCLEPEDQGDKSQGHGTGVWHGWSRALHSKCF
jgi:hypothetical protein